MTSENKNTAKQLRQPKSGVSRREFLGGAAAGLAVSALVAGGLIGRPAHAANDRSIEGNGGGGGAAGSHIRPDAETFGSFVTDIKHGDTAARTAAVMQAALVGTGAILSLGAVYAGDDPAASKAAGEALKKIVYNAGRPGASAEAKAASDSLLKLTETGQPRKVRADAIMLLRVVGGKA
jgi:hypothetical protein